MNKLSAFVRLDFLTVKPYLKKGNILMFMGLVLFLTLVGNASSGIGMGIMFGTLFAGYPFSVGEKSNMDALYTTLSIEKRMVVTGRYVFVIILNFCITALLLALSILLAFVRGEAAIGKNMIEMLLTAGIVLNIAIVVQAMQLPLFFKLGYTKALYVSLIPFFALMAVVIVINAMAIDSGLESRIAELIGSLNSVGIIAISILIAALFFMLHMHYRRYFIGSVSSNKT